MTNLIEIIKRDFGFYSDFKAIFKNKKARNKFLTKIFLYVLTIFYVVIFMTFMLDSFDFFKAAGIESQFLMTGFSPFILLTVFFVTLFIISKIYFSNQMKILLRFPVRHEDLLLSRIISLAGSAMVFSIFITVPVVIKYGIGMNKGLLFYLEALISMVTLAVITVDILAMIVIFIMKYINKNAFLKNTLKYISYVLFFVMMIGIQILLQAQSFEDGGNDLIQNAGKYSEILANYLPHLNMVKIALITDSIGLSLLYIFILMAVAAILTYILIKIFTNIMVDGILSANTTRNRKIKTKDKTKSTIVEIMQKEFFNIVKNAMYAMNKLLFGLIMVVFLVFPFIRAIREEGGNISNILDNIYQGYNMVVNSFNNPIIATIAISILFSVAVTLFSASGSETTSTTFTREGKNLWMMKIFPIKIDDQLLGRIFASTMIITIATLPILLIMLFLIKFNLISVISVLITNILVALSMSSISLVVGILIVKPDWDNPQQAIKGFQSMIILFGSLALLFLLMYVPFKLLNFDSIMNLSNDIVYIPFIQLFIVILLGIISYFISRKLYEKRLRLMGN
ncbi:MAG: hypothetical protein Q4B23_05615 [Helcococcus sp.]|nr:hypothetical protein [Helcococcus sp.]